MPLLDVVQVYNPEKFAKVAALFGQHLKELRVKDSLADGSGQGGGEEKYNWETFTPRLIPLWALEMDDDGLGPWSRYVATPAPSIAAGSNKEVDGVSNSMLLLLQLCSDVIDAEPRKLLQCVSHVEWTIIRTHKIDNVSPVLSSPPADESPPPADESPPPADESPPPADESPPPADESPPPADESPPPADESPPPADESD